MNKTIVTSSISLPPPLVSVLRRTHLRLFDGVEHSLGELLTVLKATMEHFLECGTLSQSTLEQYNAVVFALAVAVRNEAEQRQAASAKEGRRYDS